MSVDLLVDPPAARWAVPAPPAQAHQRALAGIPEGVPVVMTGHQAQPWHPGIAAKFYAARAAADALGGVSVWVVPDHVMIQPWRLRAPGIRGGRLVETVLDLAPPLETPACLAPPADATEPRWPDATDPALESVRGGALEFAGLLREHRDEPSAARQVISATADLLGPGARPDVVLGASELGGLGVLDELITAMRRDPRACAEAYNAAASQHPEAGIAPLTLTPRVELPLWRITARGPEPVCADDLDALAPAETAPRALTLTAVSRGALCDVFIHGTGGGVYDRVTDEWISRWLGTPLAPRVVVSATMRLPLTRVVPDDAAIDRAVWSAHAARHNPALIGDPDAADEKAEALRAMAKITGRSAEARAERALLYRTLHERLERARADHADQLEALRVKAAEARLHRDGADLVSDRAWPLCLFDEPARRTLERAAHSAGFSPRAR